MHAALGQRAILDVLHRLVDDLLGHGDAGVAAAAQSLNLRDRGRAFVEAAAVLGADVSPAAGLRLGLAGELHGPREHVDQLRAAVLILLVAEHLRKKQHRETVAVRVAVVAHRIADQPVRPALANEVIDRAANVFGILALRGRRAFAQHGDAGERGHRRRISALRRPVPELVLVVGQPIEPLADHLADARILHARCWRAGQQRRAQIEAIQK